VVFFILSPPDADCPWHRRLLDEHSTDSPASSQIAPWPASPLIQDDDRVIQSFLATSTPRRSRLRTLRRLGHCGRRRQHGGLQLINSSLDVSFRRSKPVSHHLHSLNDRFLHLRDLFFLCHHVSPLEVGELCREVSYMSFTVLVPMEPNRFGPGSHG